MLAEVGQALTTLLVMSWKEGHVQRTGDIDRRICFGLGVIAPCFSPCCPVWFSFSSVCKDFSNQKTNGHYLLKIAFAGTFSVLGNGTGQALERGFCLFCFCFVGRLFITGNNFGFLKERIMFSCLMELTKMVLWKMWLSCVQSPLKYDV